MSGVKGIVILNTIDRRSLVLTGAMVGKGLV